jgi:HAE1 family hydrophobic/amphiphilic exporter-1
VADISKGNLENLQIKKGIKLRDVAIIKEDKGPAVIIRDERERIGMVYANIKKGAQAKALGEMTLLLSNPDKTGVLDKIKIPAGYRIALVGTSEAMQKSFESLIFAMIAAVVLVYMVMAGQFESLLDPFAIMFTLPLSLTGAVFGLVLTGVNMSITAFIGLIMLAGIVVNNAIILIDYTNLLRARGQSRNEALVVSGATRMRPIFMTTLTTVLGMLPLALGIGSGAALYQPLAIVVMYGLTFGTFLTLVFIPCLYCFFDDIKELISFILFKLSMMFERT